MCSVSIPGFGVWLAACRLHSGAPAWLAHDSHVTRHSVQGPFSAFLRHPVLRQAAAHQHFSAASSTATGPLVPPKQMSKRHSALQENGTLPYLATLCTM